MSKDTNLRLPDNWFVFPVAETATYRANRSNGMSGELVRRLLSLRTGAASLATLAAVASACGSAHQPTPGGTVVYGCASETAAPGQDGATCNADSDCASHNCLSTNGKTFVCASPCSGTRCPSSLGCVDGYCLPACAGGAGSEADSGAVRTATPDLGQACATDIDCPSMQRCINLNDLSSVRACSAGGGLTTCIELYSSVFKWQHGYCSPSCNTDSDCSGGTTSGACNLRIAGRTLYLGDPLSDLCEFDCSSTQSCPGHMQCAPAFLCGKIGDPMASTCAPCSTP
jgi:hypothetical protein